MLKGRPHCIEWLAHHRQKPVSCLYLFESVPGYCFIPFIDVSVLPPDTAMTTVLLNLKIDGMILLLYSYFSELFVAFYLVPLPFHTNFRVVSPIYKRMIVLNVHIDILGQSS